MYTHTFDEQPPEPTVTYSGEVLAILDLAEAAVKAKQADLHELAWLLTRQVAAIVMPVIKAI